MSLSKETKAKLVLFLHRRIKPGEAFLLARLLADRIPVSCNNVDKPWEQTLQYRKNVNNVVFALNEYLHIFTCDQDDINKSIDNIWLWRYNVATGASNLVFTGDDNRVTDDFSGVMRTVDYGDICKLADVLKDANYIYGLFKEAVESCWNEG